MYVRVDNRKLFTGLLVALIALAWISLWVWGQSPYGRFLDHEQLTQVTSEDASLLVFFVAAWTVMIFAMMLPTSLPLINMFHIMTRERSDHMLLMGLLVVGYLGIWMVFGVLIHLGDVALHTVVVQSTWLEANSWSIGAGILIVAGVYQFTPLKYQCLDKCRSPMNFIAGHWSGRHEQLQAFRLGVDHGIFCVGCCWSLMLLMFAVGAGSVGWMLVLGTLMAIEKNMPWGRQFGKPLGVVLVAVGVIIASGVRSWPI